MVELDDDVISEAGHEGESMAPADLVALVERHHDDAPGAPRDLLVAYANALESQRDYDFDAGRFVDRIDDRATDSDAWVGTDAFYRLGDDRVSKYPAAWHDRLGGSLDPAAYVREITEDAPDLAEYAERDDVPTHVARADLIDVLEVVGGADRNEATAAIERAREEDRVAEDADQHPQGGVYATDRD